MMVLYVYINTIIMYCSHLCMRKKMYENNQNAASFDSTYNTNLPYKK